MLNLNPNGGRGRAGGAGGRERREGGERGAGRGAGGAGGGEGSARARKPAPEPAFFFAPDFAAVTAAFASAESALKLTNVRPKAYQSPLTSPPTIPPSSPFFFFHPHAPFITAFVPTYKPATIIYALKPAAYVYA